MSINQFGYIISAGRLEVLRTIMSPYKNGKMEQRAQKFGHFLSLFALVRLFDLNCNTIATSYNLTLRRMQPRTVGLLATLKEQVVGDIKRILINPPILTFWRPAGHYMLVSNADDLQDGWVLLWDYPNDKNQPISYWSFTLSYSERRIATKHEKYLA